MAGSHETNPITKKSTSSKKSKSKSGKSGHKHSGKSGKSDEHHEHRHELSGQSQGVNEQVQEQPGHSGRVQEQPEQTEQQQQAQAKRKGKKKVQFIEEPSSKRQRVEEDDPLVYWDGPLEAVSSKFETIKPYFNNGLFIDLAKIDELGFPHLRPFLEKYMSWLGIN